VTRPCHLVVGHDHQVGGGHGSEQVDLVGDARRRKAQQHPHQRAGVVVEVRSSSRRQFQVATSRSTGTLTIQRWEG
jgi:hypothetical protein